MSGADELKAFRVDQFGMGGMGAPAAAAPAPAAPAQAGAKKAARDAGYPNLEGLFNDKKKLEAWQAASAATTKRLEEIAASGGAQEKAEARKALRAYDHANELVKKGLELTAKIEKERAAKLKAAAQGKK
jgi:hypothetical protein